MFLTDLADFQVHASIHVAADVAVIETEHAIFAQAHHLDDLIGDTQADQILFHFLSPA